MSTTAGNALRVVGVLLLLAVVCSAEEPPLLVVNVPVADMYRSPSIDADVVSQAIFGSAVVAVETAGAWVKIRTSDAYTGWVPSSDLRPDDGLQGKLARVSSLFANLYREPNLETRRPLLTVPFESRLEITGEKQETEGRWFSARLPDGGTGWVQSGDLTFEAKPLTIAQTIALAKRFLGLPYRWGGTSSHGYDCSGFTQMLMRSRGVLMPRDSSVQAKWDGLVAVETADLQPGDLLFFGKSPQKVNHTAMYIGGGEFIHATRDAEPVVQIDRLAESPWKERFISARRPK